MYKMQGDVVVNARGDVMAQKVYGAWESKDPEVLAFIEGENSKKAPAKKAVKKETKKEELEIVPVVGADGEQVVDNPETEVNESWAVRTVKKAVKK